jgi:hypothetical protein
MEINIEKLKVFIQKYLGNNILNLLKEQAKNGAFEISFEKYPLLITQNKIYYISNEECDCYCHKNTANNLSCGNCINICYYGNLIYPLF